MTPGDRGSPGPPRCGGRYRRQHAVQRGDDPTAEVGPADHQQPVGIRWCGRLAVARRRRRGRRDPAEVHGAVVLRDEEQAVPVGDLQIHRGAQAERAIAMLDAEDGAAVVGKQHVTKRLPDHVGRGCGIDLVAVEVEQLAVDSAEPSLAAGLRDDLRDDVGGLHREDPVATRALQCAGRALRRKLDDDRSVALRQHRVRGKRRLDRARVASPSSSARTTTDLAVAIATFSSVAGFAGRRSGRSAGCCAGRRPSPPPRPRARPSRSSTARRSRAVLALVGDHELGDNGVQPRGATEDQGVAGLDDRSAATLQALRGAARSRSR